LYEYDGTKVNQVTTTKTGGKSPANLTLANGAIYFTGLDATGKAWLYQASGTTVKQVTTSRTGGQAPPNLTALPTPLLLTPLPRTTRAAPACTTPPVRASHRSPRPRPQARRRPVSRCSTALCTLQGPTRVSPSGSTGRTEPM